MNEQGTTELVMGPQMTVVLTRMLLSVVFLAGFVYWCYRRELAGLSVVIAMGVLVFGYAFYWPFRSLLSGEAIIITDKGLVDRVSGWGFIRWTEVRRAAPSSFMGTKLVALDLVDVQAVVGRLAPLRRWLWRRYLRSPGRCPTLPATFVEGGPAELVRLINARARGEQRERAV